MPEIRSGRSRNRKYGGWLFLLMVVCVYLLIYGYNPEYAGTSFTHFMTIARDLAPILLLVFLFLWLLELVTNANEKLVRFTNQDSGLTGWLIAIGGGVLSHGPVYAWYPLLQKLQHRGMRPALIAAFLYARSIKLPWLPLMVHYFGISFMLALTFYIALFSVLNGWLVEKLLQAHAHYPK